MRQAHMADAVGVVLPSMSNLMLTTRRPAERLDMPLLTLPDRDPVALARQLSREVHAPERHASSPVPRVLKALRAPLSTPDRVVDAVDSELGCVTAVLRAEGALVAGELVAPVPESLFERGVPEIVNVEGGHLLCAPVFVEDAMRPDLWLVARLPHSHVFWVDASMHALTAAGMALATWAARQRLIGERNARDRSTLLSELMDNSTSLPRHVAEHAVRAGWRLEGWHVGIQVRLSGDTQQLLRLTPRVRELLAEHGLDGPVVERTDGWACWVTTPKMPSSGSHREFTMRVRSALGRAEVIGDVVGGIGRPYAGPAGLVQSLKEAREACLFAGDGSRRGRVEHVDELGVMRVLADWYRSEAFRAYAKTLLAPLLENGEEALLETLRTYLELESSASSTASALRVHRNTVALRVSRVEEMLSMNPAGPDERLVLQLACRVLQCLTRRRSSRRWRTSADQAAGSRRR
ncbi:PucR family transcriptional regulator [Nocardioides sp. B-3]|uniref:PucR family transcriptional regulator n=1 Tax=Nocardioides sp. B-3 TaxID=2895565 RepID=UPI002152C352|nr:helix-turn-helix domain-containing protein [Nocardioides sp. B-3]UUZ59030.1 helix-turn-helix domain-containing protein [Nocardioides sp. B-3]